MKERTKVIYWSNKIATETMCTWRHNNPCMKSKIHLSSQTYFDVWGGGGTKEGYGEWTEPPRWFRNLFTYRAAALQCYSFHSPWQFSMYIQISTPSKVSFDLFCCLVARIPGDRSRRPGFDSWRCRIFWEVESLERDPLSLVSTSEALLERKSSGSRSRKSQLQP
jgi:hypothetical protein